MSNDRGHLFADVPRSKESPWGNFKGTWDDHLGFQKNRTPIKPKKTKAVENTQNVTNKPETENVPVAVVEQQQTSEPEKTIKRVQIQE